jgi:transcriptional regulator with XRE-family HTH domain
MTALRDARVQRNWSQARAITELGAAARSIGATLPEVASLKTQLSRWENGHRTPEPFYQRLFAIAYDRTPTDLGFVRDHGSTISAGGSWDESAVTAAQIWRQDVNRRDFLASTAFAATAFAAPSLHALVSNADASPARPGGRVSVGASHLSVIQDMTKQFSSLDNRYGGGQVRRSAVAFLDGEVAPLLSDGRFSASVGRSLLRSAAELARLVGWMTHDTGRHGLAQRYLIQALQLAEAAGDRPLMSETLAAMSQQATYMGAASEAVDLARGAKVLAQREGVSALVAEASVMEAHGHARAGDSQACAVALSGAEAALDQADRSADPHWIDYFDEAYLSAKFGHCLRELGDQQHAIRFAERSLEMTSGFERGRVFNLTLLAHSHAQAGDMDQACSVGQEAASTAAGMTSARVVKHLRDFRRALRPANGSDAVIALDEAMAPVLSAA